MTSGATADPRLAHVVDALQRLDEAASRGGPFHSVEAANAILLAAEIRQGLRLTLRLQGLLYDAASQVMDAVVEREFSPLDLRKEYTIRSRRDFDAAVRKIRLALQGDP